MKNKKLILSINLFIIINTIIITIAGVFFGAGAGQVGEDIVGINYFKPYTIDSNVFLGIASIFLVISLLKEKLTDFSYKLYYSATTCIVLTFLTVVFFLTPTLYSAYGINKALSLYSNDMFFFHVANPILAFISFRLLKDKKLTAKDNLIAIIPMIIYSIVYILNVVVFKNWSDFYGFTFGGKLEVVPIVIIVMYLVTYLIGLLVRK